MHRTQRTESKHCTQRADSRHTAPNVLTASTARSALIASTARIVLTASTARSVLTTALSAAFVQLQCCECSRGSQCTQRQLHIRPNRCRLRQCVTWSALPELRVPQLAVDAVQSAQSMLHRCTSGQYGSRCASEASAESELADKGYRSVDKTNHETTG